MIKKPSKPKRKALVKELDRLVSLYVRKREPFCVLCGSRKNLQCGHLFSRVAYSTRWNLANVHTNCSGCNLRHEHSPDIYQRWYVKRYGWENYTELAAKYHQTKKFTDADLSNMIVTIKHLLKEL